MRRLITMCYFISTLGYVAGQNVGIGTTTPSERLHIKNGNLKLEDNFSLIFNTQTSDTTGLRFRTMDLPYGSLLYYGAPKVLNISSHDTISGLAYLFASDKVFIGRNYQISGPEKFGITRRITTADFGGMYIETKGHTGGKPFYGYALDGVQKAYHYFDGTSDTWRLFTNGNRLAVDRTTGHLGVGTVTPADRLHVVGNIRADGSMASLNFYNGVTYKSFIQQNGAHMFIQNKDAAGSLLLGTNDVTHMTMTAEGRVLIGRNTPISPNEYLGLRVPVVTADFGGMYMETSGDPGGKPFYGYALNGAAKVFHYYDGVSDTWRLTASSDRIVVSRSNGNVGIGSTAPADRLHVLGNLRIEDAGTPQLRFHKGATFSAFVQSTGDDFTISNKLPGLLRLMTSDLTRLSIYNNGDVLIDGTTFAVSAPNDRVGIGTSAPADRLHVMGTIHTEDIAFPQVKFSKAGIQSAYIRSTASDFEISNSLNGVIRLITNSTPRLSVLNNGDVQIAGTTLSVVESTQRVGIGTSSPSVKLHVHGDMRIQASVPKLELDDGLSISALIQNVAGGHFEIHNKKAGELRLLTNDLTRLSVFNNGNVRIDGNTLALDAATDKVGIGTVGPGDKLHVLGAIRIDDAIPTLKFYSGFTPSASIDANNSGKFILRNYGTGDFEVVTNNIARMQVEQDGDIRLNNSTLFVDAVNGRVGIGTTTPSVKLNVNGTTKIDGVTFTVDAATNQVILGANTGATGYKLSVNGKIIAEEVKVQLYANWPDYVFAPDYPLMSLDETRSFIKTHGHLPGIPSAQQVTREQGIELGEMNRLLLQKIEELTLYILEQEKRIRALETHQAN